MYNQSLYMQFRSWGHDLSLHTFLGTGILADIFTQFSEIIKILKHELWHMFECSHLNDKSPITVPFL